MVQKLASLAFKDAGIENAIIERVRVQEFWDPRRLISNINCDERAIKKHSERGPTDYILNANVVVQTTWEKEYLYTPP